MTDRYKDPTDRWGTLDYIIFFPVLISLLAGGIWLLVKWHDFLWRDSRCYTVVCEEGYEERSDGNN